MKILFINHSAERCGVADYGRRLFDILKDHLDIHYCDSIPDYTGYDIALYNYHYATMPHVNLVAGVKHVGLFHEAFLDVVFDKVIAVQDLPRPLSEGFLIDRPRNFYPVIGSFGFGFPDKDFPRICQIVKEQFTRAAIRLNIPFAKYGDNEGLLAKEEVRKCQEILNGTEIILYVNHEFLKHYEMLEWLSMNDINLFLYKQSHGRGLSSAIDYALSVKRPIGVSNSEMFRHLPKEISVDNTSFPQLIEKGIEPLRKVYAENSNMKLVERIKEALG